MGSYHRQIRRLIIAIPVLAALGACSGIPTTPEQPAETPAPDNSPAVSIECPVPVEQPPAMPDLPTETPEPPVVIAQEPSKPAVADPVPTVPSIPPLLTIGEVEYVTLGEQALQLKARIDTGAATGSIGVDSIERFERDGERWIRFTVRDRLDDSVHEFRLPLERRVRIKQHGDEESERRPVVSIRLRVGDQEAEVDMTLADRDKFEYPILVGRNFLDGRALVDVSRDFLALDGETQ